MLLLGQKETGKNAMQWGMANLQPSVGLLEVTGLLLPPAHFYFTSMPQCKPLLISISPVCLDANPCSFLFHQYASMQTKCSFTCLMLGSLPIYLQHLTSTAPLPSHCATLPWQTLGAKVHFPMDALLFLKQPRLHCSDCAANSPLGISRTDKLC